MRIAYIAKHNNGGNCEELAIASALRNLGHSVTLRLEHNYENVYNYDLVLMHKHPKPEAIATNGKKAIWYFDLVTTNDGTFAERNASRIAWMQRAMQSVDICFCTDGDWAVQNPKCRILRQAADLRYTPIRQIEHARHILFLGTKQGRESFCNEMRSTYGSKFVHIAKGMHGRALASLVSESAICVAPPTYVTDNYWSNRAYLLMGYGACLMHPYCEELAKELKGTNSAIFYRDMQELHKLIATYLANPALRHKASVNSYAAMLSCTYEARCKQLIDEVAKL